MSAPLRRTGSIRWTRRLALAHDVGLMLAPLGVVALPTLLIALLSREDATAAALGAVVAFALGGLGLSWKLRQVRHRVKPPHLATMAVAWLVASLAAAVPFWASAVLAAEPTTVTRTFASPVSAWFE
ncbi:MAG: hypothetical protein AAGK78_06530, partial [Planctomycetota bacterium]